MQQRYEPTTLAQRFYARVPVWNEHRGIRVSAAVMDDAVNARAIAQVVAALELMAAYAPEQCERLPRYMQGIVVTQLRGPLATWRADLGLCLLDLPYVLADETEPELLASTIVHELTHARLGRAGIRCESRNVARCEQLCFLAERNFVARLSDPARRARAEARVSRYLAIAPNFWSDAVVAERQREQRKNWPPWLRMIYWLGTPWRRLRRIVLPAGH